VWRRSSNAGASSNARRAIWSDAKAKVRQIGRKPTLTTHQQEARERIAARETQRSVARS
jgi:hypothetical protein